MQFEKFLNYFSSIQDPMDLGEIEIRTYLASLVKEGKSASYQNQAINAIKFYYEVVEGMARRFYAIDRPMKQEKLPKVLSKETVKNDRQYPKYQTPMCSFFVIFCRS